MKVAINRCFGGFSLSNEAVEMCRELGLEISVRPREKEMRAHPTLITVIERLGERADGAHADIRIVDIPFDDVYGWEIDEYDGREKIVESCRSWY